MKLKPVFNYVFKYTLKGYLVCPAAILALIVISIAAKLIWGIYTGFGGVQIITVLYISVFAISYYKEHFLFATQNGVSRLTFFLGTLLGMFAASAVAAVGDTLVSAVGNLTEKGCDIWFASAYEQVILARSHDANTVVIPAINGAVIIPSINDYLKEILFNVSCYLAACAAGTFVGSMMYRLNNLLRIIVIVGTYLLIFLLLPYLSLNIFDKIYIALHWACENVWHFSAVLIPFAAVIGAAAYLFVRRAQIQERKS